MDAQQARELLGVGPDADRAQIRLAYDLACARATAEHPPVKAYAVTSELDDALAVLTEHDGPSGRARVRLPSRRSFLWGALGAVAAGGIGTFVYEKVTAPGPPPELLATLDQSAIAPASGRVSSLDFSPDGRTLAASANGIGLSTSSGGAFLWDISDVNRPRSRGQLTDQYMSVVRYSPDGTSVAGLTDLSEILTAWDAHTGQQILSLNTSNTDPGDPLRSVAFTSDAKLMACGTKGGSIHLVSLANHSDLVVPSGTSVDVVWLAFQPDGTLAFPDGQDSTLRFVPVGGAAPPNPVPLPYHQFGAVAMSSDGAKVVNIAGDGAIQVTDLTTAKTTVTGHVTVSASSYAAYSSDTGTVAVTIDDSTGTRYTLTVWNVPTGRQTLTLAGHWAGTTSGVTSMAVNHAGTMAAVGNDQGSIQLWDISRRK